MQNLKGKAEWGQTDWERVMRDYSSDDPIAFNPEDELYDPNDDAAVEAAWAPVLAARQAQRDHDPVPSKKVISMRLSEDVLNHYTATGEGWQERVEEVLRKAMG